MRVLEIVSANDINGAVIHARSVLEQLQVRGHELYLACPPGAWLASVVPSDRVLETPLTRWPLHELSHVAKRAKEIGIDVTHTHQSRAHSFGVLLRWLHGIPSVATAHNCRIQLHWALNNHVIGVSDRTTRFHRRFNGVGRKRSTTIHNFVDTDSFPEIDATERRKLRATFGLSDEHVVGIVLGAVYAKKGHHVALRALQDVVRKVPTFRLLVVGGSRPRDAAYVSQLRETAAELGVENHITWTGARHDIGELLCASEMMVSASLEENFPISMLEAMASGLPIVGTRVGGVPECVVDGLTGMLVEPNASQPLGTAMERLASDAALRHAYGQAGKARVAERFSAAVQIPKIEQVLTQAADQRRPARRSRVA